MTLNGETLRENTDYTITKWENNTGSSSQVTTATVTITGKGNYTGTATGNFKIASDVHTVTFMSDGSTVGTQSVVNGETANKPSGTQTAFSSHPATEERAARMKAAAEAYGK